MLVAYPDGGKGHHANVVEKRELEYSVVNL